MSLWSNEMVSAFSYDCCADIVFVVDASAKMKPIIDDVKDKIPAICENILNYMDQMGKPVPEPRVKIIAFRNYRYDGQDAMFESKFFDWSKERTEFLECLNGIEARHGGYYDSSAYEALALAMRSDWNEAGRVRRHVIILITDSPASPLGDPQIMSNPYYPQNMPKNLEQLERMWNGEDQEELPGMSVNRGGRLFILAPYVPSWSALEGWEQIWNIYSHAGADLNEFDFDTISELLVDV
ncbi:MAG: VWA domain-containing protein [Clostridia bacterium]|nr:VWA domain-containing protein [Clostridia bacterium]